MLKVEPTFGLGVRVGRVEPVLLAFGISVADALRKVDETSLPKGRRDAEALLPTCGNGVADLGREFGTMGSLPRLSPNNEVEDKLL